MLNEVMKTGAIRDTNIRMLKIAIDMAGPEGDRFAEKCPCSE
jgi:hypothetical protein